MSIVLVSKSASFALDNSMFVVEGNLKDGYIFDEDVFFMLSLKEHEDYSFVLHRLCVGGDIDAGKYEAFLHDDKRIFMIMNWIYKSILKYQFRHDRQYYDKIRKQLKPMDLFPEVRDEFGFYLPNEELEEFILEFPEFKHINV